MAGETWQQAWVEVLPDFKEFTRKADSEMVDTLGRAGTAGGQRFSSGFGAVLGGSFFGTLASQAVVGIASAVGTGLRAGIDASLQSIDLASGLGEQVNAVQVQFGDLSDEILQLSERAPDSLNLTRSAFDKLAVRFASFAKTVAGSGGRADKVVQQLTQRGADFASVYDIEVNDALALFQSGLAGETEPLRRFGLDLSAARVEAFAYQNGIAAVGTELTEAQKIQARYGALLEQTAAVQGDLANTAGSYANQQREFAVNLEEAQTRFGQALLPTANEALAFANNDLIPILEDALAEAGPVLADSLEGSLPEIKESLTTLLENLPEAIDLGGKIAQGISASIDGDLGEGGIIGGLLELSSTDQDDIAQAAEDSLSTFLNAIAGDTHAQEALGDWFDAAWFGAGVHADRVAAEQAAKLAESYTEGFITADTWEQINEPIDKIGLGVAEQGERAVAELAAALASGSPSAVAEALGLKLGIEGHIKQLGIDSGPLGTEFITGLTNAILAGQTKVGLAGATVAQAAVNAVRKTFDSHSPSRVMEREGDNAIQGLIDGWTGKPIPTLTIPSVRVPDSPAALADVAALAGAGSAFGSAAGGFPRELTLVVDGRPMRAYIREESSATVAAYDRDSQATVGMGRVI